MNVTGNYSMESRQRFMKQQLSVLGYNQEFSIDTIPLLENLVNDFLQTTDTLKHYKNLSDNCFQACHDLEGFLDAYKKDNAWLVSELNVLHLNAVAERVAYEKQIADLESRCENLDKVIESAVPKTRSKSCTRYPDKKTYSSVQTSVPKTTNGYKHLKDIVRDKDIEIKQLHSEILRLNSLLSGGRPMEAILKEAPCACDYSFDKNNAHNVEYSFQQSQTKSTVYSEKLKLIEKELINLKDKYKKLETDAQRTEKSSPEKLGKYQSQITKLEEERSKLELERNKLTKELEEVKTSYENMKITSSKTDKEILQLRRSQQELLAEKSNKDKDLKKYQEEKKYFLNRIQELSIIERDLTSEITRLCNINAIHKRHILELESKFLNSFQSKGKALLATLKPDAIKKSMNKRVTRTEINKENVLVTSNSADDNENMILMQIREKYNKQIDNVKMNQSIAPINFVEPQSVSIAAQVKHDCEHCKLAEKLINEAKEKIIALEAEKRDLILRYNENQKIVECDKQHILQLRSELYSVQTELQHYKTESNRCSRLEEETNFTIDSSKAIQKQLEIQLESLQKHLHLVEKENSSIKSEMLPLRETNLKLQKNVMDLESELDRHSELLENKTKKLNSLEKLLRVREDKISNLEKLVNDSQKQFNTGVAKSESKKLSSSLEYLRSKVRNLEKCKDQVLLDNKRLQRDLTELQTDYAACKSEMKKAKKEAAELKAQVHDYIAKVRAAEETLRATTEERSEMLDHFHTLTVEANQLESNNQTLESEARTTRTVLRNAEAKIADLEHIIQNKDALIAGYEEQLNELTKTIASLETKISNLTDQRDRLQAELDSSELFCSRSQREFSPASQSNNTKFYSNLNQISDELMRLKAENELLQNYLTQEKQNAMKLENLLAEVRSEYAGQKTSASESQEIIRGLKATIKCLQESL